jgi:hypothetical protein
MITGLSSAVFDPGKLLLSTKMSHLKEVCLVKSVCWLGPIRFRRYMKIPCEASSYIVVII